MKMNSLLFGFWATSQISLWDLRKGKPAFTFAPKDADRKGEAGWPLRTLIQTSFRDSSKLLTSVSYESLRSSPCVPSLLLCCSALLIPPPSARLLNISYRSSMWGLVGRGRHGDVRTPAGRIPLVREPVRGDGARQRTHVRI